MAKPRERPETTVTAQDLQDKWNEIKQVARRETQRRLMGMTVTTLAGVALGAGALGVAFWLGRRSGRARCRPGQSALPFEDRPAAPRRAGVLEPALQTAVNSAVNAVVRSAVNALTNRLRQS